MQSAASLVEFSAAQVGVVYYAANHCPSSTINADGSVCTSVLRDSSGKQVFVRKRKVAHVLPASPSEGSALFAKTAKRPRMVDPGPLADVNAVANWTASLNLAPSAGPTARERLDAVRQRCEERWRKRRLREEGSP